jgi:hypothetical protein
VLLGVALDLDLLRPPRLGPVVQGSAEALGDEPLADAGDRAQARRQGGSDGRVVVWLAVGVIGRRQDAAVGQLAGGAVALADEACQLGAFLGRQRHPEFLHGASPFLDRVYPKVKERKDASPVNRRLTEY